MLFASGILLRSPCLLGVNAFLFTAPVSLLCLLDGLPVFLRLFFSAPLVGSYYLITNGIRKDTEHKWTINTLRLISQPLKSLSAPVQHVLQGKKTLWLDFSLFTNRNKSEEKSLSICHQGIVIVCALQLIPEFLLIVRAVYLLLTAGSLVQQEKGTPHFSLLGLLSVQLK